VPHVTEQEALAQAKRLAVQGQLRTTGHGRDRKEDRTAHASDIRAAVLSATLATYRDSEDTWRIRGGKDVDGDDLDVVLAFGDDGTARVVTLF